jgi:large subunit ribosomal protein L2
MKKKLKSLLRIKKKKSGRGFGGRISVRHQGGEQKKYIRKIDWKRSKMDIYGKVEKIEYDPNRTASLALLVYPDGERRYILAPEKLSVGDKVISKIKAPVKPGNAMKLKNIPAGVPIHNLEILPGKGGQMIRSAGSMVFIQGIEKKGVAIKMASGEIRFFSPDCMATVGQVSNSDWSSHKFTKAGQKRLRGIRPTVRGVVQNPSSHPHGGGEGKSGIGMKAPKTPWGKRTLGVRTRKRKKYSDRLIVKRRK